MANRIVVTADSLARVAVTEAKNAAWLWRRGCGLRSAAIAAHQHARELLDSGDLTTETRAELLPFLEEVERAILDGAA